MSIPVEDGSTPEAWKVRDPEFRARMMATVPGWYNPALHMATPNVFFAVVAWAVYHRLGPLAWWHWLVIPATFMFANAVEWWAHTYLLHRRQAWAAPLYDQHTPIHHRMFQTETMAVHHWKEMRYVMIPAFGIFLIFVATIPVYLGFRALGQENVGLLYLGTAVGYVVVYEWLHFSYHLPEDSFIGKRGLIQFLKRHHAVHHDPRLMAKWNMNVSLPLWDWILGTSYRM